MAPQVSGDRFHPLYEDALFPDGECDCNGPCCPDIFAGSDSAIFAQLSLSHEERDELEESGIVFVSQERIDQLDLSSLRGGQWTDSALAAMGLSSCISDPMDLVAEREEDEWLGLMFFSKKGKMLLRAMTCLGEKRMEAIVRNGVLLCGVEVEIYTRQQFPRKRKLIDVDFTLTERSKRVDGKKSKVLVYQMIPSAKH